jgi:beta-phosphoglucomutase
MKAFIFDLDGVIVDTAKYHYLSWKRLAREFNFDLTEEQNEQLKGVSRADSLDIILHLAGKQISQEHKNELANKKNIWFVEHVLQMTPAEILPGVKSLLQEIKSANKKIALASSSKNAKLILDKVQLIDWFDVVVDGTMIKNSKPDPEIFFLAAKLTNTPINHCLVFEDAEAGVEAAFRAGMKCVGIGSVQQLHQSNYVVKDLSQINLHKINSLFQSEHSFNA